MSFVSRGFRGRRRQDADPSRVPPGQYVTRDFPVLSAGPTPPPRSTSGTSRSRARWTSRAAGRGRSSAPTERRSHRRHPLCDQVVEAGHHWKGVSLDALLDGIETSAEYVVACPTADTRRTFPGGRYRRESMGRLRVRRRAARSRARRARPSAGAASLFLEEREVGAWARASRATTSRASGRATGTTTTAIHGESSGTGATDLAARDRGRARRRDAPRQEHRPRRPGLAGASGGPARRCPAHGRGRVPGAAQLLDRIGARGRRARAHRRAARGR